MVPDILKMLNDVSNDDLKNSYYCYSLLLLSDKDYDKEGPSSEIGPVSISQKSL